MSSEDGVIVHDEDHDQNEGTESGNKAISADDNKNIKERGAAGTGEEEYFTFEEQNKLSGDLFSNSNEGVDAFKQSIDYSVTMKSANTNFKALERLNRPRKYSPIRLANKLIDGCYSRA